MKPEKEFESIDELSFSDAFYGTYKLDPKDGKPHLKEGLFHPFKDIWRMIFIFSSVVGGIMLPLMLSMHLQYFRNAKIRPEFYDPPVWQDYILVSSFGVAFVIGFLILVFPRILRCKSTMHICFIACLVVLNLAQVFSHYALGLSVFDFSFRTLITILWLIISGCIETHLYGCGICLYAAGLTAGINYLVAKWRIFKFKKYKSSN